MTDHPAPSRHSTQSGPGPDLTADIGLLRIDHVGIAVADLDAAIARYQALFGMACVHREVNAEQGVSEAMLAAGESTIQLLAPLSDDSTIARFLARRGPGLQQLAFAVADIRAAEQVLRSRGVRVLYDTARVGTAGTRINFVHPADTEGVLIELVQQPR